MPAVINPIAQSQFFIGQTPAPTACPGRVSGVNGHQLHTGAFSLVGENGHEPRPTRVVDGLGEVQTPRHALHVQIFMRDLAEPIHKVAREDLNVSDMARD